ncbi:MAG: response regulator [Planctomycetota bacterium]
MKCLLVDDEPGIREGLAMLLRRRGYEVQTAEDCAGAAAELEAQRFDVVVTDWRLPDGTAVTFAAACDCPVLAVSGHPEEVQQVGAIRDALAKPVRPDRLLQRIAELVDDVERTADAEVALVRDVQQVVDDVLAQLPDGIDVTCHDDGTFVVLRAALPADHTPTVRHLGGDLRVVENGLGRELELRLCRDGRPDPNTPVVAVDAAWPEADAFALDCDGTDASEQTFSNWCAAVAERNAAGGRICLLNVPARLEPITAVWETTHDMPMRERVGPRLSAELAELWS